MFNKLRTVIYQVNDIDQAKEWYIKATGIQPYFDQPFYVGFDINGFELGLDPNAVNKDRGNQTVSYWSVEDADKEVESLVGIGAKIIQEKTSVGGAIFVAIVEDPFGNHIGIIEGA